MDEFVTHKTMTTEYPAQGSFSTDLMLAQCCNACMISQHNVD